MQVSQYFLTVIPYFEEHYSQGSPSLILVQTLSLP